MNKDKDYTRILSKSSCYAFLQSILIPENSNNTNIILPNRIDFENTDSGFIATFKIFNKTINATLNYGTASFGPYSCYIDMESYDKRSYKREVHQKDYAQFIYNIIKSRESEKGFPFSSQQYLEDYNAYCNALKNVKIYEAEKEYAESLLVADNPTDENSIN